MSTEADFLRILLALKLGFFTKEEVVENGPCWAENPQKPYFEILAEKKGLKPAVREALDALVQAQLEENGGDASQSLAAFPIEEEVLKSLLTLPLDPRVKETLTLRNTGSIKPDPDAVPPLPDSREGRYRHGREIGRGGLGRVLAARDEVLGREVAIKEMLPVAGRPDVVRRFLREGEIAGKLSHPNIIPVLDILARDVGEGAPRPNIVMTRIHGRDLRGILRAVEKGEGTARHDFSRPRLLRIFQDVCLAMAYAHDQGVIHRDLKPANIMVGNYGEVYVVDWGLAKLKGVPDSPDRPSDETDQPDQVNQDNKNQVDQRLTTEGDILGTPAYMSPEQAEGQVDATDERSDIYSLGAILYEILTLRPPFEGKSISHTLTQVLAGECVPPSRRALEGRGSDLQRREDGGREFPSPIPPELDEITLKALAKVRKERYASARELSDDIQLFLEGEKERERNHRQAVEKVAEGKRLVARLEAARREREALEREAEEKERPIEPHWPVEKKRDVWRLRERIETLREVSVQLFTRAGAAFQEALGFERNNAAARSALADLYWDMVIREEASGDRYGTVLYENLVRQYNDGQYDEKLKGDGTLAVSTRTYPCPCLSEGREVHPDEMQLLGYHPFSGRGLDRPGGGEGKGGPEGSGPETFKVHGPSCMTESLAGADVWLFRYEEHDKILLPRFPQGVDVQGAKRAEVPRAILDRCFDPDSPYRPGEGLHLGKTPVQKTRVPRGSYLLLVCKPDYHPVCVPVNIMRFTEKAPHITLYRSADVPEGFLPIPEGAFVYQGDGGNPNSLPKQIRNVGDIFLAPYPVQSREYLAFLNELASSDPEGARRRSPRETETSGHYWPRDADGRFAIPTAAWLARAPEALRASAHRLSNAVHDWEEAWPVYGVSWEDAMAYGTWLSRNQGRIFTLPTDVLWEKAARGDDERVYPWGMSLDPTFTNNLQAHPGAPRPCPVDSFPVDESPYGIRGLGGNISDWCLNDIEPDGRRHLRGGSWLDAGLYLRLTFCGASSSAYVFQSGFRLAWVPVLGIAP
ncbi:MAG: bifunctional serine/threonine-protein kinase/formylglycine-generating enzyme family protein [Planctomycetota bacterium]